MVLSLVPMAGVTSVPCSIEFYRKFGFEVGNTFPNEPGREPCWAWLVSREAHLMLALADKPVVAAEQRVLFYLYCSDVEAMRSALLQQGIAAGEISRPFYAPKGEFRVEDPDGYVLIVTHT